jgi:hypothetical protein
MTPLNEEQAVRMVSAAGLHSWLDTPNISYGDWRKMALKLVDSIEQHHMKDLKNGSNT